MEFFNICVERIASNLNTTPTNGTTTTFSLNRQYHLQESHCEETKDKCSSSDRRSLKQMLSLRPHTTTNLSRRSKLTDITVWKILMFVTNGNVDRLFGVLLSAMILARLFSDFQPYTTSNW
jgi:hypothetical protein